MARRCGTAASPLRPMLGPFGFRTDGADLNRSRVAKASVNSNQINGLRDSGRLDHPLRSGRGMRSSLVRLSTVVLALGLSTQLFAGSAAAPMQVSVTVIARAILTVAS